MNNDDDVSLELEYTAILYKQAEQAEELKRIEEEKRAWELNPNRPLLERQKKEKEERQEKERREREVKESWERVELASQNLRKPYFNHKY